MAGIAFEPVLLCPVVYVLPIYAVACGAVRACGAICTKEYIAVLAWAHARSKHMGAEDITVVGREGLELGRYVGAPVYVCPWRQSGVVVSSAARVGR